MSEDGRKLFIALADGIYDDFRIRAGQRFMAQADLDCSWAVAVDEYEEPAEEEDDAKRAAEDAKKVKESVQGVAGKKTKVQGKKAKKKAKKKADSDEDE